MLHQHQLILSCIFATEHVLAKMKQSLFNKRVLLRNN